MPSRLHEELHEGITRSQTGPRGGTKTRAALATLAAVLLVLASGWAALSTLGGDREARAQSSDGGSGGPGELAQAAPEDGTDGAPGAESEPSYIAFGEPRNPFALVVEPAEEQTTSPEEGQSANEATAPEHGDDIGGANTASGDATIQSTGGSGADDTVGAQDTGGSGNQAYARQPFGSPGPEGQNTDAPNQNVNTGPNGERVDCANPADEFEQLLCEDHREGFSTANGGDGAVSGQQQGPPGSGGSGRSGAGQPAEEFRNGGGGFVK